MTYSQALNFIGKCLSLSYFPDRANEIRDEIRSGHVEWEQVVWVCTGQFVFPAVYIRLKRSGLLPELPSELVRYMKEFTDLNRLRNQKIVLQILEITELLNKNNITPVLLKGCAHLLDRLYEDIAERQVGDIDLLVDENEMVRAAEILIASGYTAKAPYNANDFKFTKHYPRLLNDNREAAVEIHRQVIGYPAEKALDCHLLLKNARQLEMPGTVYVLCNEDQVIYNVLHTQITHGDYYFGAINIRQCYDLFLLSQRTKPLEAIKHFGRYYAVLNCNLAFTSKILGNPDTLKYDPNLLTNLYLSRIKRHINHPVWERFSHAVLYLIQRFSNYIRKMILITYDKNSRQSLFSRLSDPTWYVQHLKSYKQIY